MVGIRSEDLRINVIRPTLKYMGLWSESAENLLLGTAAQESKLGHFLKQIKGPALGIYQIEPNTHRDVWENFLKYRDEMSDLVKSIKYSSPALGDIEIITNIAYATAIARLIYLRAPEALPEPQDVEYLAKYWKKHYNTPLGKGTEKEFIHNYTSLIT